MIPQRARQGSRIFLPIFAVGVLLHVVPVATALAGQAGEDLPERRTGGEAQPFQQQGGSVQEFPFGWTVGARGGFALPSDDSLDAGPFISGVGVFRFTTDLELEIEAGYTQASSATDGLPEGDLTLFPVRATVRVRLWPFRGAEPYAGGGAGMYLSDFSIDNNVINRLAELGFDVEQDLDSGVGVHAAAGVEWRRDNLVFGVDVKYVIGSLDGSSVLIDRVTGLVLSDTLEVELDGLWVAAGMRIRL